MMITNTFTGITRPGVPTLADLQRRRAELSGVQQQPEPQPQVQTRPAAPTPPPSHASENPGLGEAALYGVAGLAVRALARHTEAPPAAALEQLMSLGAICQSSQPSGGRPSTLWSAIAEANSFDEAEIDDAFTAQQTTNEESMQQS